VDANQVVVSSKIAGRLVTLNVQEGSPVKAGDLIATIDSDELIAARDSAKASLASMRSQFGGSQYSQKQASGETENQVANSRANVAAAHAALAQAQADQAAGRPLTKLQQALIDADGLQCGYCTPGFVMTLHAFLKKHPQPTEAEVRRACAGNLCRCGSYPRIFSAVMGASGQTAGSKVTVITPHDHALA